MYKSYPKEICIDKKQRNNQNKKSCARIQTRTAFYKNSNLIIHILNIATHLLLLPDRLLLKQCIMLEIIKAKMKVETAASEFRF